MGRRAEDALNLALLAAAVAIGAFLRFHDLGVPSYWLDEALDELFSRDALSHPWWHWITGFGREHGPLHFAIQLLAADELTGRLPAASFGLAAVPLIFLAAKSLDERAAGVCALLLATSPFHVYYSREARPYALLMLLAVALLVAVLRDSAAGVGIVSILALYTSAIAAALVAAAGAGALAARRLPAALRVAAVAFAVTALFPLLYRSEPAGAGAASPHIDLAVIARAFTVSATGADHRGHTVLAMLVFAAIGAVALLRRDRRTAAMLLSFALLPIAIVVAIVFVQKHFFALRYIATALPPFLLLAGIGITTLARTPLLGAIVAVAVLTQTWTPARIEPLEKLNWRQIAREIVARAQPGDTLVTADAIADVMLRHYLRDIPHGLRVASIPYVSVLEAVPGTRWIATTYNTTDFSVREWSCRHPLLLASDFEGFRLHYAGASFLRERATLADMRAIAAIEPLALRPGTNDELFLGEGWAAADHVEGRTYRWATSRTATLFVPRIGRRDRTLVFHALPVPPQTMTVFVNGVLLGRRDIAEGWHEYAFRAPAAVWRDGINTIRLDFARTTVLKTDPRSLAVLFESIRIGEGGDVSTIPPLRISSLVDRPGRSKHSAPASRDLLVRLGLDPSLQVETGDAARTVAWGPECEDDRTFLYRAFATILERGPNAVEERDLMQRMERGTPRSEIVSRILDAQ